MLHGLRERAMDNMSFKLCILLMLALCLLDACMHQEVDIIPGTVYRVTTTESDGFAVFQQLPNHQWRGTYYLDEGGLMAVKRSVELKTGDELALVDSTGKEIPILSYSSYEEPEFKDYPETWAYSDSAYAVTEDKDVPYGHALGYWASYPDTGGNYKAIYDAKRQELEDGEKELTLTMDVYLPNDNNDVLRPLLILIHGGAFFNGDKADCGFPAWAHRFASRGYVVASVNYRLGFKVDIKNLVDKGPVERAGIRAVQDVDAAIRYMIHHAGTYLVDSNRVFVAGTSAGGITALNVAFMKDEDIPFGARELGGLNVVNPEMKETYSICAVGNLWGAVNSLSILNNKPNTSVISVHCTNDPVVPFSKGSPFQNLFLINNVVFPTMYGSMQITAFLGHQRALLLDYNLDHRHTLHYDSDEAGNNKLNSRFFEIDSALCNYFSSTMLPSPIITKHDELSQTFMVTSNDLDSVFWRVEGGAIQDNKNNRINVLLFPDAASHTVIVSGKYKNGMTFRHQWPL